MKCAALKDPKWDSDASRLIARILYYTCERKGGEERAGGYGSCMKMSHGRKCTEERKSFLYRKAAAATTRVREGREGRQGARRSFLLPSGLLTAVSLGAPQAPGVGTIESHLRKNQSGEVTEGNRGLRRLLLRE